VNLSLKKVVHFSIPEINKKKDVENKQDFNLD